jgi:hypothetical protein
MFGMPERNIALGPEAGELTKTPAEHLFYCNLLETEREKRIKYGEAVKRPEMICQINSL